MIASDLLNDTVKDMLIKLVSENKKLQDRCDMIISHNSLLIKKVESQENEIKTLRDETNNLKDEIKILKENAEDNKSNITVLTNKLDVLNKNIDNQNKSINNSHLSDYEKENAVKILYDNIEYSGLNWYVLNYQRLKSYLIINDYISMSNVVHIFYKLGERHYFAKYVGINNSEQFIDKFICNIRDNINNKYSTAYRFGKGDCELLSSFACEIVLKNFYVRGETLDVIEYNIKISLLIAKTLKKYGVDIYTKYHVIYTNQYAENANIIELIDRQIMDICTENNVAPKIKSMLKCVKSILLEDTHQDY